ncbi:MAG TPA: cbb3-type cytochrome c oxidase N-terminal domain-containing protein, partial [Bacteroidia bacterium]|nr:cbb3-type cytochrome c oxidase N-terminal domain-containing protein [Bacteroidia bacterium]
MKQLRKLIAVDWKRSIAIFVLTLITATTLNAQAQTQMPPHDSVLSNALFDTMLAVVVFLLIIIVVLADVLKNIGIGLKEKNKGNNKWLGLISLLLTAIPFSANAQEATTKIEETVYRIGGMEPVTFWSMLVLIGLEVTVLAVIIIIIRKMIGVEEQKDTQFIQKKKEQPSLLEWANASVPLEKESEVLLDHNYDGIRELDNDLPPWWKYGFYLTIIFACIYLTHYHITKTGDLQIAEYNNSLKAAELEAVEYRKKAANLIDETSVKLLTDAGSLAEGKEIFKTNCAQCHGPDGGGKVGPNLTDDYWLHGGAIKDVFKTIKNGYQDKG